MQDYIISERKKMKHHENNYELNMWELGCRLGAAGTSSNVN